MSIMLLASLVLLTSCAGSRTTIHPIEREDIMPMPKGTAYTPDRDGYFFSDEYIKDVMDAKIK